MPNVIMQGISRLITEGLEKSVWEQALTHVAEQVGDVSISNIQAGPYTMEALPPRGDLVFDIAGAQSSVTQALSGIDALVARLNKDASAAYLARV